MIAQLLALLLVGGPATGQAKGVRWERHFDEALKKARAARKPVMVDFWAEWCGWCHRLDQTTYADPLVSGMLKEFVTVKVNTEGGQKDAMVALRYDVSTLPTIAFLSPSGRQLLRLNGFQGPGQFPATVELAKETAAKVMAWEDALERNANDASALAALGGHLFEQEFYEDSRELLYRAAKADAQRPAKERKHTRMLLGAIQKYDRKYSEAEALLKEALAVKPGTEEDAKILYILGKTYVSWGRTDEARSALKQLVSAHSQSPVAARARDMLAALDKPNKN